MNDKNNVFIMGDSYSTYEGYIPDGCLFHIAVAAEHTLRKR